MAKFTYDGVEGAADPKGTFAFGVYFPIGKAVEIDDPAVIGKLGGHPHFSASDKEAKDAEHEAGTGPANDKARDGGRKARIDGKPRSVPPAYRGKPEGEAWLAGYDEAAG